MFAGYVKSGWKIIGYYTDDDTVYFGMTNNVTIVPAEDNALLDLSTWYDLMGYGEDQGITGIAKQDAVTYSLFGAGVWVNTVRAGFDAAKNIQPTVSTWAKGSRIFGRGSNILSGMTIAYDFATGTANTSTLVNAGVTLLGGATVIVFGAAATPYVVGFGIVYGIISVAGGDDWLNSNFDISDQINIFKPNE